jgi:para-nitrobenzyl esterase
MKNSTIKTLVAIIGASIGFISAVAQCDSSRYRDMIFPYFDLVSDIAYGNNVNYDGTANELLLDVYTPQSDTETQRPLVIMAHGGFFVAGDKTGTELVPFCEDLARMGYVVASIEYRMGIPFQLDLEAPMTEAVLRGVQDMKAAIRYFRKTAAEDGNPYSIDTEKIFIGGISAGGFISLHSAYMQDDEIPSYVTQTNAGLGGGVEGLSGNPDYSSDFVALISISGAIGDSLWIEAGDKPACMAHGTGDTTVPYGSDMLQIGGAIDVTEVDGSHSINEKMDAVGIEHCFEVYWLQGHVPSTTQPAYYDTTLSLMSNFLSHYVCPQYELDCEYRTINIGVEEMNQSALAIFPNPAQDKVQVNMSAYNGTSKLRLYDGEGRMVLEKNISGNYTLDISSLNNGVYSIQCIHSRGTLVQKLIVQR